MSGIASPSLSDAQATQVLNLVRQQLQLVLTSPTQVQPGQPLTATLSPPEPMLDVSDLAVGVLNLAWAAKDVLFTNPNPVELPTPSDATTPDALDGDELLQSSAVGALIKQPFPPPLPGGASLAQTPGVAAQLFGTFSPPRLQVGVAARWRVHDQAGNELQDGKDFIATQGLTSPNVSLVLPPIFRELRLDTMLNPGGTVVCLSVDVTLTLGPKVLPTFVLGPVPVLVLPLFVPTVVVLFSEPNFGLTHDSAALIIVPKHSPFASAEPLFKVLRKVEAVTDALRSIGGLASFFLGLGELLGTVPEQPRLRFAAADRIEELQRYKIKRRPWYDILGSDPDFDDEVESLMVFGLPGTRVQFFNDEFFKMAPATNQGNFDIQLRNTVPDLDFFVAVRTLDTDDDVAPETFPPDRVPRFQPDQSGDGVWHTDMSSVRFHQTWLDTVGREIADPLDPPPLTCSRRRTPRTDVASPKKGGATKTAARTVKPAARTAKSSRGTTKTRRRTTAKKRRRRSS
jgi:hypothetical protein